MTTFQSLPLALANRAFVWIKLLEFSKAHLDLLWIIKIGTYPMESLYKIYQRLGIVLQKLQKVRWIKYLKFNIKVSCYLKVVSIWIVLKTFFPSSESIEAFGKAIDLIKHAKIPSDQKMKNKAELENNMKATEFGTYSQQNLMNSHPLLDIIKEHTELQGTYLNM